jgi:uncharacterized protein (TIGR00369 family)
MNNEFSEREARVRESFSRQGFMRHLGAEVTKLGPGECEIQVPYRGEMTQQHGYFHAGVAAAIADSACGYAAYGLMPATSSVLTVEYKINLVAPAAGEIRFEADPDRMRRRMAACAPASFEKLERAREETRRQRKFGWLRGPIRMRRVKWTLGGKAQRAVVWTHSEKRRQEEARRGQQGPPSVSYADLPAWARGAV